MSKMAGPAATDSDPIGKELDECKELLIDIPLALEPPLWPECCIYRVPKRLREINEKAYTPRLVSIGPFHHRREELRNMEMQKLRYLRDFCYRTRTSHEDLVANIQLSEVKIRRCYDLIPNFIRVLYVKGKARMRKWESTQRFQRSESFSTELGYEMGFTSCR